MADTTTCPVCGMAVDKNTAPAKAEYQGKTYYFCSNECKQAFQQNPKQYAQQPMRT